jgi:hypothetical protein
MVSRSMRTSMVRTLPHIVRPFLDYPSAEFRSVAARFADVAPYWWAA